MEIRIKTLIYIFAMVLIASGVSATYTLYDFEDFESYPISQGTLRNDSNVEWGCGCFSCSHDTFYATAGDDCTRVVTALGGEWGWEEINTTIRNGESTKALRLIAMNGTDDGSQHYSQTMLSWNHTDTPNINSFGNSAIWFKKSYWLMMNDPATTWYYNDASPYINQFSASYFSWGIPAQSYSLFAFGTQRNEVNGMGGYPYNSIQGACSTDLDCRHLYFELKPEYYFQWFTNNRSGYWSSDLPNCYVDDGEWHFIEVYDYITGVDDKLRNHYIYVDGAECINYSLGGQTQSGTSKMESLTIIAQGNHDFWIDDISIYAGNTSPPVTGMKQCGDGIDNDGDGFTDYPADPSCTGYTDSTESPYDYVQCNNGIDDDLDGFTDYPDDPSCENATDSTEFPADGTSQPDNVCLEENFCIFREQFPYTDAITLHGWYGNTSEVYVDTTSGNRLVIYNIYFSPTFGLIQQDFDFYHNITHDNIYNDIQYNYGLIFESIQPVSGIQNFYIVLYDSDDREVMKWRYDFGRTGTTEYVNVYTLEDTQWIYMFTSSHSTTESDKLLFHTFAVDQILKTFEFLYVDHSGLTSVETTYNWTDIYANRIYRFGIVNGNLSGEDWEISIDNIYLLGEFADTVCDTWELPYYLVETFNGNPSECDWIVNEEVYADGTLQLTDAISFYSMQKETDLAQEVNTRYVTLTYDLNLESISVIGSTVTFRLYDDIGYNFFTAFYRDTGDFLMYNDDGTGKTAGAITLNTTIPYKFVIDLQDDNFDIYINGTKVVDNSNFASAFANVKSIQNIKIQASDANFELDNIKLFASDSSGSPLLPDDTLEELVEPDWGWCRLFWKNPTTCSVDDDCETGICLPTNQCSGFDWTYCDEKNKVRGSMCVVSGMTSCVLSSTGEAILSNFFLFLILLVLLMFSVYLVIAFRQR